MKKSWIVIGAIAVLGLGYGVGVTYIQEHPGTHDVIRYKVDEKKEAEKVKVQNGQGIQAILNKVNGEAAGKYGYKELSERCKVITKDNKTLSLNGDGNVVQKGYQPRPFQEGETIVVPVLKEYKVTVKY